MKAKHGIIFDCDGTLVNSMGFAYEAFNSSLEKVGQGHRTLAEIKKFMGASADRIFFNMLGDEALAESAFQAYLEFQRGLAQRTQMHAGIRQLLETLKAAHVPMGIVTGRHELDLEIVLKPHGLESFFQTMVTDNQLPKPKPAPDGILRAALQMGLSPQNTFYVGDSVMDLKAARAAGGVAVAAVWDSLVVLEEMQKEKPHFIVQRPEEIWPHFQNHFSL